MKRFLYFLLLTAATLAAGCGDYDDSELGGRLDGIRERIAKLQSRITSLNDQLADLSELTSGNVITAMTQDSEGNYIITYKDNKNEEKSVVLATVDQMLNVPLLGVEPDPDSGLYYWTVTADGQTAPLLDKSGERVPVSGHTPVVSVDEQGCWTVNGERLNDAAGRPIEANDGESCLFQGIARDANGNLSLTLGNGEVVTLPIQQVLNLTLSTAINTTVVDASAPMTVKYTLHGEHAADALVGIAAAEGIEAALDKEQQQIVVTFPAGFSAGHLIAVAYDMLEHTVLRPVFFAKATSDRIEIRTAAELVQFAADVNAGTGAQQMNAVLMNDIDLKDVARWTPIGDATFTLASNVLTISEECYPFTGRFDGQGHTISNFRMVCDNATPNRAWGLFGALGAGAVVENLVFDASCSLEVTASKATDCGILAGLVYDATVRNVTNEAPMSFNGSAGDNVRMTMGMIGLAFANEGAEIDRLTNEADLTAESGGNTKNGATGVQIGGICGFSSNLAGSTNAVAFTGCVNRGNLTTKAARASGIVAAANRYTHLTDCTNYGNNFNEFATAGGARIGAITCITGQGCRLTGVVNHGDVICKNEGGCGSIVCLVNHADNEFVECENYGRVISDRENNKYKGSFFGQCNMAAKFRDCIAQGDVGTYNNGNYVMVGINADNYMDYLEAHNTAAVNVTRENILYYPAGSTTPAEATFSVAPGSVELNALGTNAAVVSLSAADYDWTVSTGGNEWVKITDLNDMPLTAGTKSPYVQQIRITADVNPQTEPRPATVTFTSTDQTQTATVSVMQEAAGPAFPSQWIFSASTVGQYNSSWSASNMLPSTSGSSGYISVVRGDANAGREFTRTVSSYKPSVSTMVEGDYWLYTLPVKRLEAGTAVEFDATMAGEANSPKYFIVEYLDGGVWKSVEEDLLTAPEDPSIRYSYKCSGVATGTNYQHASVMQTIRFTDPVEGAVQIRCRAVGRYTCAGGTQNISASSSASLLPPYGFSGSYVQNLGTAVPGDTKKVLCLGNSFSYYSNPAWMLKEIAWNEGHYLNIKGHFKGSQNFGQHLGLSFSTDAIDIGGYDYAFIQDQSQNPATYGRDGTASIAANCTALADKIRAKSASCKVILEQTWTFSAGTYGGFTDFATFESYNAAGARAMAEAAGTWVSPIGVAFRIVREGSSGINLYHTDNKHQSVYGAYLKACVNYLVLYGEAFGSSPADCGIEAPKAAYLRSVAEQVVLGHENEYLIQR